MTSTLHLALLDTLADWEIGHTTATIRGGDWQRDALESDTAFDVLETLSFLVEHSLVTADDRPYGEPRFRMLETVRDYAVEQLRQAGEYDDAMRRLSGLHRMSSLRAMPGSFRRAASVASQHSLSAAASIGKPAAWMLEMQLRSESGRPGRGAQVR